MDGDKLLNNFDLVVEEGAVDHWKESLTEKL